MITQMNDDFIAKEGEEMKPASIYLHVHTHTHTHKRSRLRFLKILIFLGDSKYQNVK